LNSELPKIPSGHPVDIDETHEEWYKPARAGTPHEAKSSPRKPKV
jgi:hypothetical protein